jgi:tripartite ATP-independent transporter DctP family solute receptor
MGVVTSGPFDEFLPEARVVDYPYLFASYSQVDAILDGAPGKELLARLEKAGFEGLAFSENGFRHITNGKRPIHTVKDVADLKIRVMESLIHETLWRAFGAVPVAIGSLEKVRQDLRSGAVDGQENPLSAIWENGFYRGQKYLSLTGHVYSSHIGVAGLTWYRKLPAADQKIIRESMEEAAKYERKWNRANEAGFLAKLKTAGLVVDEAPDIASFRTKSSSLMKSDLFKDAAVTELLAKFLKAAEKAR